MNKWKQNTLRYTALYKFIFFLNIIRVMVPKILIDICKKILRASISALQSYI